jgi:hypothetical protein
MRTILSAAVCVVLVSVSPAAAHQLDEYLQATRISIEPDRIVLDIGLTPGVALSEQVFASIDRNDDTLVSESEIESYGRQVLQDLALEVDGRSLPLRLMRAESPSWPELRDGVGTMRVRAAAEAPVTRGHHRLRFVNNHQSDISVYLVNALMPSTRTINVREQQRDVRQRGIRLEFERSARYPNAPWILFPFVGVAGLVLYRRGNHAVRR